mgnify:CR=1 FL=1
MCSDIDDDALTTIMTNHLEKNLKVNIIRSPPFENKRLNWLVDIEVFANGKVVDDFLIQKVEIMRDHTPE